MEFENYNGWTNRDTWLVMLWIENTYENYTRIEHKVKGIGTNKKLEDLTCCELMEWLKRFNYGDKINWNKVNLVEIKQTLLEEFKEV